MQFIKFKDKCTIERSLGRKNKYDEIERELIHEGECLYEEGGQSWSYRVITRNPTLYLPKIGPLVYINDYVTVVTDDGRTVSGLVEVARDVELDVHTRLRVTRIELKQATGK